MAGPVPERIRWAVDQLGAAPGHRVLEVGCGPGVALALLVEQVTADGADGTVLGVDRSATAVERSRARNADAIARGALALRRVDLADLAGQGAAGPDLEGGRDGRFDRVLAVNVNVFWTSDADRECATLADVLRPDGELLLVFDGPGPGGVRDVGPGIAARLLAQGLSAEVRLHPGGGLVAVAARRPA